LREGRVSRSVSLGGGKSYISFISHSTSGILRDTLTEDGRLGAVTRQDFNQIGKFLGRRVEE